MTKREHTALIAGVSVLLDEALDDLARLTAAQEASLAAVVPLSEEARLLDYLPRQYRARYNVRSRHLLVLWGDLELEMQGPFADEAARFAAARDPR